MEPNHSDEITGPIQNKPDQELYKLFIELDTIQSSDIVVNSSLNITLVALPLLSPIVESSGGTLSIKKVNVNRQSLSPCQKQHKGEDL